MSARAARKARRLHRMFYGTHYTGENRAERRRNARAEAKGEPTLGQPAPRVKMRTRYLILNRATRRHVERGQQ